MAFAPPNLAQLPGPGELRYGLFTAARGPLDLPSRAGIAGLTYESEGCGTPRGYQTDCDETPGSKTFDANVAEQGVLPFGVYATVNCGTAGYRPDYLEAKARRKLLAVEQHGVEQALWSGAIGGVALGNKPTFQDNNAIGTGDDPVVLAAAATLTAGIAALEEYATDNYGYVPVLHAEARLAAQFGSIPLIRDSGNGAFRTRLGTLVSFGGGYPGTSNAGAAAVAGHAWLAITGQVTLWRDPEIFVAPAVDTMNRTLNQYNVLAERTWAATYDCFVAMIDVTL